MCENNIGAKLIELRTQKGVTQDEVADALSVSNKTVSKWENGASAPDLTMLAELSKYYQVTTDTLLGLSNERRCTSQVIADEFKGLDRRESVLKTFEIIREIFPASFDIVGTEDDDVYDNTDVLPQKTDAIMPRYQISLHEMFNFMVCSDDVNLAVLQLRNKSNFSWLTDEEKQSHIVKLFEFLADPDVLKVCALIHTTTCSEQFTADYAAKNTGVTQEKASEILDRFSEIGVCTKIIAHLTSGEVPVYESFGDGVILSLISLAYERMCGRCGYNYNYNGRCKMIRGEKR